MLKPYKKYENFEEWLQPHSYATNVGSYRKGNRYGFKICSICNIRVRTKQTICEKCNQPFNINTMFTNQ